MTTTTPSASSAPAQATPPASAHARAGTPPGAPADLFASLLALVADAPALPDTAATAKASADTALSDAGTGTDADEDATADPLAALLAWVQPLPGTPATAGTPAAGGTERAAPADTLSALAAETRRLDSATERAGAIELPAAASPNATPRAAAPAWLAQATRAMQTTTDKAPGSGNDLSLRWQRGASPEQAAPVALAMRSTVTLGERSLAPGAAVAGALAAQRDDNDDRLPGASAGPGVRGSPDSLTGPAAGVGTDGGTGDSAAADSGHRGGASDHADAPADPLAQGASADDAVEVNHWGHGHLRNASLRVGEAGEQAIDIQLAVRGDEVQVAFRTDDAQARDLLREQAGASLADLLQASGMQLGGVSVGAHGGQGGPGSGPAQGQAAQPSTTAGGRRAAAGAEPVAAPAARTRADGGPALDLFI